MVHRTQLYLDEAQYHYLKNLARKEETSIAGIIRNWIEEKREKRAKKKLESDPFWKIFGMASSGKPDIAQHFDDYLYGKKK